jgi:hypothetical protein
MAKFFELRSFDNYIEANIVLSRLRQEGINCHLKDENIITIDPLLSPAIGGMKLMVFEQDLKRAWDLMEEAETAYLKSIPCPICKKHSLKITFRAEKAKSMWGALASMLLKGQQIEIKKTYNCGSCGYDFTDLPKAP